MMTQKQHGEERRTGKYTGPTGKFFRIVDPSHPTHYYGWGSTREACEHFSASPDLPDRVTVESAPQLTAYEAGFRDLAGEIEPKSFDDWRATQEYLLAEKIPTIHQAD